MLIHYLNRVTVADSDPIRPFQCKPDSLCIQARDEVWRTIENHPLWEQTFTQGKMIGILIVEDTDGSIGYLTAYSGIVKLDDEAHLYFVPPIYDLDQPDDFYRQEESVITAINHKIRSLKSVEEIAALKEERRMRSLALQQKIFRHFQMLNRMGIRQDLIEIFNRARHGLPPGGTGECAAPRLFQYAFSHGLRPLQMAEFWYGRSSAGEPHAHGASYPSCMEKCGPTLDFMLSGSYKAGPDQTAAYEEPRVLWENDDLVVLSKPAGMLSVPAKDESLPNVESWLLRRYPQCKAPMLVHRLDMSTSGILVAAKNADTHRRLQALWLTRNVHKHYLAWVPGRLPSSTGLISLPLCPNPDDRPRQSIDWQWGKTSITRYRVIRYQDGATLLDLSPLTGRTHQLRVHLSDLRGLGHPILGDNLYGWGEPFPPFLSHRRLMLHAASISWRDDKWQCDFNFLDNNISFI